MPVCVSLRQRGMHIRIRENLKLCHAEHVRAISRSSLVSKGAVIF